MLIYMYHPAFQKG